MNINDYEATLSRIEQQQNMMEAAISDIAKFLGHTDTTPISAHVLFLTYGFTFSELYRIVGQLYLLAEVEKTLTLSCIQNELTKITPEIANFPKKTFKSMIKMLINQFEIPLTIPEIN